MLYYNWEVFRLLTIHINKLCLFTPVELHGHADILQVTENIILTHLKPGIEAAMTYLYYKCIRQHKSRAHSPQASVQCGNGSSPHFEGIVADDGSFPTRSFLQRSTSSPSGDTPLCTPPAGPTPVHAGKWPRAAPPRTKLQLTSRYESHLRTVP